MAFGARIFLSYCAADQDWTRAFVEALRWAGGTVWLAELGHAVGPATDLEVDTERELLARSVFVAVLSPSGLLAAGLERDVRLAARQRELDRERVTLVVLARECRVPRFWYGCEVLSGVNGAAMLPQEAGRRVDEVLAAIAQRTRRTPSVAAPSVETAAEALASGQTLRTQGRTAEALAAYDRALELNPSLALAWYGKGNVLLESERYEEAADAFEEALKLDPSSAPFWHAKGLALAQLEQVQDALDAQEQAVALDPALAPAWSALGAALTRLGKHEDALDAYERSLELDPRQPQTWRRKGDVLQRVARPAGPAGPARGMRSRDARRPTQRPLPARTVEDALDAYDRALELAPQYLRAWNNKIHLLDELGRPADATKARRERERAILGS